MTEAQNIIEQLYERYLEITEKEEKMNSVVTLAKQLMSDGVIKEYYDVGFDKYNMTAYASSILEDKISSKIEEIESYLGAIRHHVLITTEKFNEKDPAKLIEFIRRIVRDNDAIEFIERAMKLGLKVTVEDHRDYVIYIAYTKIAENDMATAYITFEYEVLDP